jgi:predicted carbohydrate-binding protein with CBM5 and CBM33 domain
MTPPNNFTRHDKYKEKQLVFKALYNSRKALTRRELSEITDLEIATLCRILNNETVKSRTLKISFFIPFKTTGQNVYHYNIIDAVEGLKNGN